MRALLFVPYYIEWHYFKAPSAILRLARNFTWFIWHFFSIGLLARTLFAPWQRLQEKAPRGLDVEGYLSTLTVNTIVRVFGACIRLVFIVLGLLALALIFTAAAVTLILWLVLPGIILFLFLLGIIFIIKPI